MTYDEIKAVLPDLVSALLAKGIPTPSVAFRIDCSCDPGVSLMTQVDSKKLGGSWHRTILGNTPAQALSAAAEYIANLPDPATEGERLFTRKLAEAVDIATEYALPDAVIAPVRSAIREVNALLLPGAA